jgi:ADP-heptose:LPS heptosyltransferase
MKNASSIKHILVIRLSAMGDVAITVPVLRAFCKQYPTIKLTVLTRRNFAPFFRDLPNVNIFNANLKGKHKGFYGLYKLSKELKSLEIDAVADLHNVLRSNILRLFLRGITYVQIDKGRKEKSELIAGKKFEQLKPTYKRYTDVFSRLGFEIDLSNPTFPVKAELSNAVLEITGKKEEQWIGIAPFAAHESKMYPLEQMKEVINELQKEHKVFLFGGGKKEIAILNNLESKPNCINLAGKLSLAEEMDVISNLDVMLSMDSGNAHVAAMLDVPVVTIWGVTHPYAGFMPYNQPLENCLLADREVFPKIPTSVYGNNYPENYKNAAGIISPDTVVKKIKSLL